MGIKMSGSNPGGMDEINVTPLIDVVLVLLIIFMVLTPITVQKMASSLPPPDMEEPPEPPPDQPPDQLLVAVYADGSLALNLKANSDLDVKHEVAARLRGKAKKTVFIDAHPDANYGRVVNVMDMVREAGAEKVGLTDMKDEGPAKLEVGAVLPVEGAASPAVVTP